MAPVLTAASAPPAPRATGEPAAALTVRTLGAFSVVRDGTPLTIGDWQSRKARDLFKLLVARRGTALTRDAAIDVLWPDEDGTDPELLRSRLSVALSTLRKVLDPAKALPADHFVGADGRAVRLRVEHVDLDLVTFLGAVEAGEAAADRAEWGRADALLAAAQASYAGDFLEEDRFEDWSVDCREHARSAALRAARLRADLARRQRDDDRLVRHLERVLELDPYDEPAWLLLLGTLAGARRHGEARRQRERYVRRMREIGVAPEAC